MIDHCSRTYSARTQDVEERWLPVVGWEDRYEVSDQGRIRSLARRGRIRSQYEHKRGGYLAVDLYRNNRGHTYTVHVLVALAFHGRPEPGQEVRHLNGASDDNRASNLSWGTHSENMRDRIAHGRDHQVNKTSCPAGHPYDDANTAVRVYRGSVSRRCRQCHREQARARYRRTRGVSA